MRWEEAEKTRLAIAALKKSKGWAFVIGRIESRKDAHLKAALECGPPTENHTFARERLNELEDLISWIDELEANATSLIREMAEESDDIDEDLLTEEI